MSFSETIFLFFLALIIFGPKKLPEIARQVGKWMNEFRRASNEFKSQIEQEIAHLEFEEKKKTILPPSPAPEGTASRTLNAAPVEASASASASVASAPEATPPDAAPVAATADPLLAEEHGGKATESSTHAVDAQATPADHSAESVISSASQESHA